ncbi:MAG: hypothetical protein ABI779_16645 [Acidobacteriota bacterium]
MSIERNVFEWRRFGHWDSSAAKARLSAFVLWKSIDRSAELGAECGHHGGDAGLALGEAFSRESAIAIELIVKAVIARRMQKRGADPAKEGVPATHDVPQLWKTAGLPALDEIDTYRLHLVKQTLVWSGRYATPRTPKAWEQENRELAAVEPRVEPTGRFRARTPIGFSWDDFDRLYQIADTELTHL